MNKDCEAIVGPCTCGAWHSENEVLILKGEVRQTFIPGLGTVRTCIDCGGLIAGGPTRCVHCVRNMVEKKRND